MQVRRVTVIEHECIPALGLVSHMPLGALREGALRGLAHVWVKPAVGQWEGRLTTFLGGCGQPAGRQVGGGGQDLEQHCNHLLASHHGTVEPSTWRPKQLSLGDVRLQIGVPVQAWLVHVRSWTQGSSCWTSM